MKLFILLSLILCPLYSVNANPFYLPEGAVSFSQLGPADAKIKTVNGKEVVVDFDLSNDCDAEIGPISYELIPNKENGNFELLLSIPKINTAYEPVFCFLGRHVLKTIQLPIAVEKELLKLKIMKVQWDNQLEKTGTLKFGQLSVGGETTGIVLKTPDGEIELVIPHRLMNEAKALKGHEVSIFGVKTEVFGPERGARQVISVRYLKEVDSATL